MSDPAYLSQLSEKVASGAATSVATSFLSNIYSSAVSSPNLLLIIIVILVIYIIYSYLFPSQGLMSKFGKNKTNNKKKTSVSTNENEDESIEEETDKLIAQIEEKQSGA